MPGWPRLLLLAATVALATWLPTAGAAWAQGPMPPTGGSPVGQAAPPPAAAASLAPEPSRRGAEEVRSKANSVTVPKADPPPAVGTVRLPADAGRAQQAVAARATGSAAAAKQQPGGGRAPARAEPRAASVLPVVAPAGPAAAPVAPAGDEVPPGDVEGVDESSAPLEQATPPLEAWSESLPLAAEEAPLGADAQPPSVARKVAVSRPAAPASEAPAEREAEVGASPAEALEAALEPASDGVNGLAEALLDDASELATEAPAALVEALREAEPVVPDGLRWPAAAAAAASVPAIPPAGPILPSSPAGGPAAEPAATTPRPGLAPPPRREREGPVPAQSVRRAAPASATPVAGQTSAAGPVRDAWGGERAAVARASLASWPPREPRPAAPAAADQRSPAWTRAAPPAAGAALVAPAGRAGLFRAPRGASWPPDMFDAAGPGRAAALRSAAGPSGASVCAPEFPASAGALLALASLLLPAAWRALRRASLALPRSAIHLSPIPPG